MKEVLELSDARQETYSIRYAADYLGVSSSCIRKWSNDGLLDYVLSHGGHRRYSVAALKAFKQKLDKLKQ